MGEMGGWWWAGKPSPAQVSRMPEEMGMQSPGTPALSSGAGSTLECHQHFPATPEEQGPCSRKAALAWRTVVPRARLAKRLPRLCGQVGTGSTPGRKSPRSGWGVASQKVKPFPKPWMRLEAELRFVNTWGSCATWKKTKSEAGIFCRRGDLRRARSGVSARLDAPCYQQHCPGEQPWDSLKELLQPRHPRSREVLPGAGERFGLRPPPRRGVWKSPADGGSKPGTQADPTNVAADARVDGREGCLCFTAAKHKESPPKSPQSWSEVSWKHGMGSPGRRRERRSQHKELRQLLGRLWLRLAVLWEVPGLGFGRPSFHALALGKDRGDIKVLGAGKASWSWAWLSSITATRGPALSGEESHNNRELLLWQQSPARTSGTAQVQW